jgi:hypothetical protein
VAGVGVMTIWNLIVLFSASTNAIAVGVMWHNGSDPTWFVWVSSIMFSIGVAVESLSDLVKS